MHLGEQNSRAMSVGQVDLVRFERGAADKTLADWSEAQRLAGERETLGLFLSGHPITPYEPDLKFLVSARWRMSVGPSPRQRSTVRAAGRPARPPPWPAWCWRSAAARIVSRLILGRPERAA
jgi:DNA polymerase III alpha subunit